MKTNFTIPVTFTNPDSTVIVRLATVIKTILVLLLLHFCLFVSAQSGKVFRDFNNNGLKDSHDAAVKGIIVRSYYDNGNLAGADTTDKNGIWKIVPQNAGLVRVEFEIPDSSAHFFNVGKQFDFTSYNGDIYGTSVQFVDGKAIDVNFAINNAVEYCGNSPYVATPCYVNGDPLPNGSDVGAATWLVKVPFAPLALSGKDEEVANGVVIGSTWALANQRSTKSLFAAAFMKRHSGLGTAGTGGIYKIDMSGGTPIASLFVDLKNDLGINTGDNPRATQALPTTKTEPNHDSLAFDAVGKIALGGMDISDDEKTMWVVNLFDQTLYELPIGVPAVKPTTFKAHPMPNLACQSMGIFRPFAVKYWRGKVYVGGVCTAENDGGTPDNLSAYVFVHDPNGADGNFTQVLNFDLNYPRGCTSNDGIQCSSAAWQPWIQSWDDIKNPAPAAAAFHQVIHPQPILSDLEFDSDGSLILGFVDRMGHQGGNRNYSTHLADQYVYETVGAGDLLRAAYDENAQAYQLENNAQSGDSQTIGKGNGQGPGGGEFYWQDMFAYSPDPATGKVHDEVILGGLSMMPDSGQVVATAFNPVAVVRAGGFRSFDNKTGAAPIIYEIFTTDAGGQNPVTQTAATFGKAAGLGDMEMICEEPKIEIGNRVWKDTDGDGIQDAGEVGIKDVIVELYEGNTFVKNTTTNLKGEYYFKDLKPNTDYKIRINNAQFNGAGKTGTPLANLDLTTFHANSQPSLAGVADNDAQIVGGLAEIAYKTGSFGQNDHTLDIGFKATACIDVALTNSVINAKSTCKYAVGDTVSFVVKIFRQDNLEIDSDTIVVKGHEYPGLKFVSYAGTTGIYDKANRLWTIPNLPLHDTLSTVVTFVVEQPIGFEGGLICSEVWVQSMKRCDVDSKPGDKNPLEDDYDRACISLPIKICKERGEKAQLIAPDGFTTYQWFVDGKIIDGANLAIYETNVAGNYTVQVDGNKCPTPNCCPVVVEEFCPCLSNICIPYKVVRAGSK